MTAPANTDEAEEDWLADILREYEIGKTWTLSDGRGSGIDPIAHRLIFVTMGKILGEVTVEGEWPKLYNFELEFPDEPTPELQRFFASYSEPAAREERDKVAMGKWRSSHPEIFQLVMESARAYSDPPHPESLKPALGADTWEAMNAEILAKKVRMKECLGRILFELIGRRNFTLLTNIRDCVKNEIPARLPTQARREEPNELKEIILAEFVTFVFGRYRLPKERELKFAAETKYSERRESLKQSGKGFLPGWATALKKLGLDALPDPAISAG